MKYAGFLVVHFMFLNLIFARAATKPTADTGPFANAIECSSDAVPIEILFRQSFRSYPQTEAGVHQFLLIRACKVRTAHEVYQMGSNDTYRLIGTAYFGKEADGATGFELHPVQGAFQEKPYQGDFHFHKIAAHGDESQIMSDDGTIAAEGNFTYRKDIFMSVNGARVRSSLVARGQDFPQP